MRQSILLGITAIAAASVLMGCSDEWGLKSGDGAGCIAPLVGIDNNLVASAPAEAASRAEAEITAAQLSLRLTKADGSYNETWETVSDFPLDKKFGVGAYTMEAFYGDAETEGFECPAFYGTQSITVKDEQTTELGITASRSNCRFVIGYTEAFKKYMSDWSATVKGAGEPITYAKDETRPVYVKPGEVEITVSVTKPNGLSAQFTLPKVEAKARYHYNVTVDVNNGNVGDATLTVTFDPNLQQEEVPIDISDKILGAPAPTAVADGFTSGTPISVVGGLGSNLHLAVNLMAAAKLGSVMLATSSPSLVAAGWPESIDLLQADAAQQATLTGLGLNVLGLWHNPDQMAVVDFSGVVGNIKASAEATANTFTLTVKDAISRAAEPVELVLNVEGVKLQLASTDQTLEPGEPLDVTLGFNGTSDDLRNRLSVEYLHPVSATWKPMEILSVSEPLSRGVSDFTVTLATPSDVDKLQMRAKCADIVSGQITVKTAPFDVVASENDIYATHAYVTVTGKDGEPAPALSAVSFIGRVKGTQDYAPLTAAIDGNYAHITGLQPDTDYELKVEYSGLQSKIFRMHTEAAPALANGDMETWTSEKKTSGAANCMVWYPESWNTLNLRTTGNLSIGSSYSALSSTLSDEGGHNGKGALIRSVGYDVSANSAGLNNAKKFSQGELYLGNYNGEPEYGINFASRPSSLTFWYKYTAQNSADRGYAEIAVLDNAGNVISTVNKSLDPTETYTAVSLDLGYAPGAAKAASLRVIFRSTNAGNTYLNKNDIPKKTGALGVLNDYYVGSKLYIDDITLNY